MPFKSYSAIFPIILSEDQQKILLHLRQNTGYCDGYWDTAASGHVNKDETAKQAVVRECREEIGININVDDLEFAHLTHHFSPNDRTYYHLYFVVKHYCGIPIIMEPDKNVKLNWFCLNDLPNNVISCRKTAIELWVKGISYSEIMKR